jgi:hypothetical protein
VVYGFSFNVDGADWANFGAFAARGARARITPMLIKVHNNLRVFAAQFEVKSVNTFDFVAYPYASSAQDAPVSVDN